MTAKSLTFNVRRKLGSLFQNKGDRIAHLTEKMRLGVKYESLVRSEHWPIVRALLDSKADTAVQKLKERRLKEDVRLEQNARAALIQEIYHDIETEISRAQLAKAELEKIKEIENGR